MQVASAARKAFLEDEAFLDLGRIEEPPANGVWLRMHGVAQLKRQQPLGAFVDPVVVWLGDANAVVIADLDQPSVLDREAEELVDGIGSHVPAYTALLPASMSAAPGKADAAQIVHDPRYGR